MEEAPPQSRYSSTSPFIVTENGSVAFSTTGGDDEDAHGTKALEEQERKTLAAYESKALMVWRIVVYFVVLLVGLSVSLGMWKITSTDQHESFESTFGAYAGIVRESFFHSIELKFGAISSFSTTITSFATYTNASFPNVTIPDFELRGAHSRIDMDGVILYWMPLVTDETRSGWEEYAEANHYWINDAYKSETKWKAHQDARFGLGTYEQQSQTNEEVASADEQEEEQDDNRHRMLQEADPPLEGQTPLEDGYNPILFGDGEKTPMPLGSGPYLPLWQLTPVIPIISFMNFNLLEHIAVHDSLTAAIESQEIVMSQAHDVKDPDDKDNDSESLYNAFLLAGQYRHMTHTFEGDPTTNLAVPVFDSFDIENRTLGGILMASIYWRLLFSEILPNTAVGIICVLENSLNQSFTYRLDGPKVTFLGPGDRHDPKYDDMVVFEDVTKHLKQRAGPENQAFDTVDLNEEHCQYQLRVYPSQDTEDKYVNEQPMVFTLIVVGIFLFTSVVFILYDLLVARRQRIVMRKAVQAAAVVNALYPKQVQDRLFKQEGEKRSRNGRENWKIALHRDGGGLQSVTSGDENNHLMDDRPIADFYEASTILFADLAGFTKWSSTREPVDVFFLLETLYQAFDKIAVRRKVFKVETIGDCYVAVTGLPDPQPDHAVIMVKFARDCYAILNKLLSSLSDKLGKDTLNLNFRVGLHSGPITGGVLRGQKSRFQLFGDTINTASRMESNGVPGRIHISQSTADELEGHGFKRWLTPREDKIVAKGKGELQTYFVSIQREAMSVVSGETAGSDEDQVARMAYNEIRNDIRKSLAAHQARKSTRQLESSDAAQKARQQVIQEYYQREQDNFHYEYDDEVSI